MHAARVLNTQRKRRQDQRLANVRRLSAVSGSRSPINSTDLERLEKAARARNRRNNGGVNCAYVGFALAIFGSIPLIVGTFIAIPALWEVGLTVTIVGILLGVVFWCGDFWKEAKGVGPVIPKPKAQIGIYNAGRIQDIPMKPPISISALEKDELMTVVIPESPGRPHIIRAEPKKFLQPEPRHFALPESEPVSLLEAVEYSEFPGNTTVEVIREGSGRISPARESEKQTASMEEEVKIESVLEDGDLSPADVESSTSTLTNDTVAHAAAAVAEPTTVLTSNSNYDSIINGESDLAQVESSSISSTVPGGATEEATQIVEVAPSAPVEQEKVGKVKTNE